MQYRVFLKKIFGKAEISVQSVSDNQRVVFSRACAPRVRALYTGKSKKYPHLSHLPHLTLRNTLITNI